MTAAFYRFSLIIEYNIFYLLFFSVDRTTGKVCCVILHITILQWISTFHTRGPNRINAESALQHSHREREKEEACEILRTGTLADVCM